MKVVIDIPDKIYNTFHKGNWSATYDGKKIRDIVMNGTPLPKGHGRLIDADALEKKMCEAIQESSAVLVTLDTFAPTIIEAADKSEV